jgi:Tfp pilus assembly protein PilX
MGSRVDRQRGSVLATTSVVLAGLVAVAGISVISVQRSAKVSSQQREHVQALHAAEAGVAAAASFLRTHLVPVTNWGAFVAAPVGGEPVAVVPVGIEGNGEAPGAAGNPFAAGSDTWYEVSLYNNPQDPGYEAGEDHDAVVIIRSIGHGPDRARVVLEVEVGGSIPNTPVKRRAWREVLQ